MLIYLGILEIVFIEALQISPHCSIRNFRDSLLSVSSKSCSVPSLRYLGKVGSEEEGSLYGGIVRLVMVVLQFGAVLWLTVSAIGTIEF